MRSLRQTPVCCDTSLCQHPDCWRLNLQRVREAVWRRNGIEPGYSRSTRSMELDQIYSTKEQRLESTDEGLPTLNVVDMFSDLDSRIKSAPDKQLKQQIVHKRSSSLPSLSPDQSQPFTTSQNIKMPHPTPAVSPFARTEYQRKMLWKNQFTNPSKIDTPSSRDSENTIKISTIGVHEIYEPEELFQDWEEVYVTSAYLVWCPSNKKKRKTKKHSKDLSTCSRPSSKKVIPKDVTEDFIPAAMETVKPVPPKSTKTPTGGQPFSPHKSPPNQTSLKQYGMEDLSDLPKPILSGMLKRISQRSNETTPQLNVAKKPRIRSTPAKKTTTTKTSPNAENLLEGLDLSTEFESLVAKEETASKVRLAVDINSRFTTPEEDEEIEKQKEPKKIEKEKQETEADVTTLFDLFEKDNEILTPCRVGREILRLNSIGVPVEDLPSPKSHHCRNSIPRRLSLGAALEPVNIVAVERSPSITPNEQEVIQVVNRTAVEAHRANELFVKIPHGRSASALDSSLGNSPSPVRAPAPTPISPDKYSEFFRQHSRISQAYRTSSLQDDEILTSMRKWNTLSNIYDAKDSAGSGELTDALSSIGREIVDTEKGQEASKENVFLTEGFDTIEENERNTRPRPCTPEKSTSLEHHKIMEVKKAPSDTATRGRSPSPGSRTRIPKDVVQEFHGSLYGKHFFKVESKQKAGNSKSKETVLGPKITASGWRPPRSRTPIQFSETPARFAPRPLKQPPQESVPKSLQIVPIHMQKLQRPKSTPPRITIPNTGYIGQVLSESSLLHNSTIEGSLEVHGPSTNVSGTGSVPPPPSPETLVLSNELKMAVSTLEPLCEEDERSSRTTSIAELAEKEAVNPRLSPLGGGSEVSEESIDLPKELCDCPEGTDEESGQQTAGFSTKQEGPLVQYESVQIEQHYQINDNKINKNNVELEERKRQCVDQDPTGKDKAEDRIETSFSTIPEFLESNDSRATKLPQDSDSLEFKPPSESEERPKTISLARGSPELAPQPPGSPDITSEQDFTEGVDMNLDLTAELKAAIEGLDDFVLDDDDDDENEDKDENINSKYRHKGEGKNDEESSLSNEENDNENHIDGKMLEKLNDGDDENNANGDNKVIPDTMNGEQNNLNVRSHTNELDSTEGNSFDRSSPLLETKEHKHQIREKSP